MEIFVIRNYSININCDHIDYPTCIFCYQTYGKMNDNNVYLSRNIPKHVCCLTHIGCKTLE